MSQQDVVFDESQSEAHQSEFVTITINNVPKQIHRGQHRVADIKLLGGIPAAYVLLEVIHGVLTPLADDGHVTIKGEEVFFGEPQQGRTS